MINNQMSENAKKVEENPNKKPDDSAGFYFSSSIKIFDPNSNEILVQKRGDN